MYLIPFDAPETTLAEAGGKGANLVRLTRAGFAVPPGFIIATDTYREFVASNGLADVIRAATEKLIAEEANALENASQMIRATFAAGHMSADFTATLLTAYQRLSSDMAEGHAVNQPIAVAVRSSATAEDLPDMSFAGQQDSYLNIIGPKALCQAVVDCWGSLWTARAIGYRMRNGLQGTDVALAVIVQVMVPSEVSGVMFTANPLSGLLTETVIDATFGLGEALVAGLVEPDHFVADSLSGQLKQTTLGAKKISIRGQAGGGVQTVTENAQARPTLAEADLRRLVATGQAIQNEYGLPQDIEWALAGDQLSILQSRAITSLFPIPQVSFNPLLLWFSFGAVQGLVGPLTPLGQDAIQHLVAGAGKMFGLTSRPAEVNVMAPAGERLWIRISDVMRHPIGQHVFDRLLGFIEPSIGRILRPLSDEPGLGAGQGQLKFSTVWRLARFAVPVLARLAHNVLDPEGARARFDADIDDYLRTALLAPASDRFGRLAALIAFMQDRIANAFQFLLPKFIPIFGPSMAGLVLLTRLSGDPHLALEVTRGLPRNVTTEMDLALWATARAIRAEATTARVFHETQAAALAQQYLKGTLPTVAQAALTRFMEQYGMRGVGEIDFGQLRWREDPTPVMHTLQSYLDIDPEVAPDVLFARGEQAALTAIERIATQVRHQSGGWLKEKLVRAAARRIRLLMGTRESPKFFAIRTMGLARQAMLAVGREFVEAKTIEKAEDLAFLKLSELEALAHAPEAPLTNHWPALIAERRLVYDREQRRRQVPRVLASDGRAFYDGLGVQTDTDDVISGNPVSPGVVEGVVHVVLDPRGTHLAPGEILVCPGTDPAWTPLFMAAGGLITEVGGMMTHGSVVAREYGIPAVVGVHQATTRLKDGQRIRVDGTLGKVMVLGPAEASHPDEA